MWNFWFASAHFLLTRWHLEVRRKKSHMTDFTKWSDNSSINPEPDVNWDSVISKAVKLSHLTNANFTLTLIKNGQQAD